MPIVDEVKKLVQSGKLEAGLKSLTDWAEQHDDDIHNTTILLSSRFNQLKRNTTIGLISDSDANRDRNRIAFSVLSTLDDVAELIAERPELDDGAPQAAKPPARVPPKKANKQKKVFISYAREDRLWVDSLEKHLSSLKRQGLISSWSDSQILPGQNWNDNILTELRSADIIIFMLSADFIASEFINENEVPEAMEQNRQKGAKIIPVVLRPCDWSREPYNQFQALPDNALPITKWADQDEAFMSVVKGLSKLVM